MKRENHKGTIDEIARVGGLETSGKPNDPIRSIEMEGDLYRSIGTASKKDKLVIKIIKVGFSLFFIVPSILLTYSLISSILSSKDYILIPVLIFVFLFGIPGYVILYRCFRAYINKD